MTADTDNTIQHKAVQTVQAGFGFENGERVPVQLPEGEEPESEAETTKANQAFARFIAQFFAFENKDDLWQAVQVYGFKFHLAAAPHTIDELQKRLGVGRARAYAIINAVVEANPELFSRSL